MEPGKTPTLLPNSTEIIPTFYTKPFLRGYHTHGELQQGWFVTPFTGKYRFKMQAGVYWDKATLYIGEDGTRAGMVKIGTDREYREVWTDALSLTQGQWVYIEIDKPHGIGQTWKESGDLRLAVLMEKTESTLDAVPDSWKSYTTFGDGIHTHAGVQYVIFSSIPPELLRHERENKDSKSALTAGDYVALGWNVRLGGRFCNRDLFCKGYYKKCE